MALHTKKDFADLCRVNTKYLATYIGRGKVVLTGEFINDTNELNAAFLKKCQEKNPKPIQEKNSENSAPAKVQEKNNPVSPIGEIEVSKSDKELLKKNIYELEKEFKIADIKKKEVDTRLALLREEKLKGEAIPTKLVKSVISVLSKSMTTSFKDGVDSFLIQISKIKGLSPVETAKLKGDLVSIINSSNERAVLESKKSLKIIVAEFSTKRGVGEK